MRKKVKVGGRPVSFARGRAMLSGLGGECQLKSHIFSFLVYILNGLLSHKEVEFIGTPWKGGGGGGGRAWGGEKTKNTARNVPHTGV